MREASLLCFLSPNDPGNEPLDASEANMDELGDEEMGKLARSSLVSLNSEHILSEYCLWNCR